MVKAVNGKVTFAQRSQLMKAGMISQSQSMTVVMLPKSKLAAVGDAEGDVTKVADSDSTVYDRVPVDEGGGALRPELVR
jgi:hypothetical protein